MVVALLVNQLFPSSRGLETKKSQRGIISHHHPLDHHHDADDDVYHRYPRDDQDVGSIFARTSSCGTTTCATQRKNGKRKPFRAMYLLTSLASDFDVVSDWIFFLEARAEDRAYREEYQANGSPVNKLPYLVPPFLLCLVFVVCCIGTFMWLVLATDGRVLAPILRLAGKDTLSMGHMLLLSVLVEDVPQVLLTFFVEEYYEDPGLSNYAVYTLLTSLYDTIIKLAEAYDERYDIVETGDWLKESIQYAHQDTITSVVMIPLPPSAAAAAAGPEENSSTASSTGSDDILNPTTTTTNNNNKDAMAQSVRGRIASASAKHRRRSSLATEFSIMPTVQPPRLRFLTTSLDKTIRLWDTFYDDNDDDGHNRRRRERCVRVFRGHLDGVTCLCILGDPNNNSNNNEQQQRDGGASRTSRRDLEHCDEDADETTYFVTGCKSGNCKMWNLSGDCLRSFYVPFETKRDGGVTCVTTVVEGNVFACGYQACSVRLWEAWTGALLGIYKGHDQPVSCIANMSELRFITGSLDGTVKLWDASAAILESNREPGPVDVVLNNISSCSSETTAMTTESMPHPSARLSSFLSSAYSQKETTCQQCFHSRSNSAVLSVACVEPKRLFVAGYADAIVRVWSLDLNLCLRTLVGHEGPISSVLSMDRSTMLTGSHDKTVKIWDAVNGVCLRTYQGQGGTVSSVSVAHDNTTFLTAVNQTIKVWVISSVPPHVPDNDETLDQILEANLGMCRGYEIM